MRFTSCPEATSNNRTVLSSAAVRIWKMADALFMRDNYFVTKNLEIGVSTKLIVTARIRGNVPLKNTLLHIQKIGKINFEKKLTKKILKKILKEES